jgi:hypothetical protein
LALARFEFARFAPFAAFPSNARTQRVQKSFHAGSLQRQAVVLPTARSVRQRSQRSTTRARKRSSAESGMLADIGREV